MERERESKGKHCGLWTGPNANTALPSVDEGLLALSRNQVVPRRNTGRGREKGGREREKQGKKRKGTTVGKNGQWTNERTPSIVYLACNQLGRKQIRTCTYSIIRATVENELPRCARWKRENIP